MSLARPVQGAVVRGEGWALPDLRRFEPATLVGLAAVAALLFLVVSPVARLALSSVQDADTGAFTLRNYATASGRARDLQALGASLLYAAEVTVLSAVLAVPIAWAVARTDMPAKGLVRALILGAIGWIVLAGCKVAGRDFMLGRS